MAGRFHDAQLHAANIQLVAFFDCAMRKPSAGLFAEDDLSASASSEFAMAADEISMQMRFDDVLDLEILRPRFVDVLIDIGLRIDNRGFAVGTDQVRGMSQTTEIELFEEHRGNGFILCKAEYRRASLYKAIRGLLYTTSVVDTWLRAKEGLIGQFIKFTRRFQRPQHPVGPALTVWRILVGGTRLRQPLFIYLVRLCRINVNVAVGVGRIGFADAYGLVP